MFLLFFFFWLPPLLVILTSMYYPPLPPLPLLRCFFRVMHLRVVFVSFLDCFFLDLSLNCVLLHF